jgi:hypothetical protein
VHKINCKAGTAARRELGSFDHPTFSGTKRIYELQLAYFCAGNTNQRSKHSADFALSVLFEKRHFPFPYIFKAKVFGCSVWLCRRSTITPPHPSYQYSIRQAERNYKERLHFN